MDHKEHPVEAWAEGASDESAAGKISGEKENAREPRQQSYKGGY
jgi:hypothetical protein